MRPTLKQLNFIQYDHFNKIDYDIIWDQFVSKPRNTVYACGDSLYFIIKWREHFAYPIYYISSYNLQLMMVQQHILKNDEFEYHTQNSIPNLYKNLTQKLSCSHTIKIGITGSSILLWITIIQSYFERTIKIINRQPL